MEIRKVNLDDLQVIEESLQLDDYSQTGGFCGGACLGGLCGGACFGFICIL